VASILWTYMMLKSGKILENDFDTMLAHGFVGSCSGSLDIFPESP
jgi:hypothetical protein